MGTPFMIYVKAVSILSVRSPFQDLHIKAPQGMSNRSFCICNEPRESMRVK